MNHKLHSPIFVEKSRKTIKNKRKTIGYLKKEYIHEAEDF
jgi:hypothetical protein